MNRTDLAHSIATRTGVSVKDVTATIAGLNDVIVETVARGEKFALPGLVSFERVERAARTGRNPKTGAPIDIPAHHAVKVTAGSKIKDAVRHEA